jgi:hypothetical protein
MTGLSAITWERMSSPLALLGSIGTRKFRAATISPTRFDRLVTGMAFPRPSWIPEGDVMGLDFAPEDLPDAAQVSGWRTRRTSITAACCRPRIDELRTVEKGWYRYGDSNPGPVAENHVS